MTVAKLLDGQIAAAGTAETRALQDAAVRGLLAAATRFAARCVRAVGAHLAVHLDRVDVAAQVAVHPFRFVAVRRRHAVNLQLKNLGIRHVHVEARGGLTAVFLVGCQLDAVGNN